MTDTEILLLVAVILFAIAGVVRALARSIDSACVAFGLGCFALYFLVL